MKRHDGSRKPNLDPIYSGQSSANETPSLPNPNRPTVAAISTSHQTVLANRYSVEQQSRSSGERPNLSASQSYPSDPHRSSQQSFDSYSGNEMYNMLSPLQHQHPNLTQPFQQYSSRQVLLPSESSMENVPQDYLALRPAYHSAGQAAGPQHGRSHPTYVSNIYSPTIGPSGVSAHSSYDRAAREEIPSDLQSPSTQPLRADDHSAIFATYHNELSHAYQNIHDHNMKAASEFLISASTTLLRNASKLNLGLDIESTYASRLALFRDFNKCWLALGQTQIDLTEEIMKNAGEGRSNEIPDSFISLDALEGMGHTLIELCDSVQRLGLVDYEMGVEEERILDILIKCMDCLRKLEGDEKSAGGRPDSWPSRADNQLKSEKPSASDNKEKES